MDKKDIFIAVIGCGGTGSWFVTQLGRLFGSCGELRASRQSFLLLDADIVSRSNVIRQNFSPFDIDERKGLVLQRRLIDQYKVQEVDFWCSYTNTAVISKIINKSKTHKKLIIISCVDNHATRNRLMSVLKPNPDSWEGCLTTRDWVYLDAGNDINDGWVSSMVYSRGFGYGLDMRQQDINQRNPNDTEPSLNENGYEYRGCGATTSSPETYWGNQQNAYLLGMQLRSLFLHDKAYGVIAWSKPNFDSNDWHQQVYQTHMLSPYELR